jgi:hypothetical protein
MNRPQYAFLGAAALVALAATGCASSPSSNGKSATSFASSPASPSSPSSPASASSPSNLSGKATTSAPAGPSEACGNAVLNASLAPPTTGRKQSVYVIAVKNTGPACDVNYLPYVWITPGPDGGPEQTRPLVPSGLGGGPNIIATGQTLYAAIDLNPGDAPDAVDGYTFLAVTANPTPDTSGKDVQELKLPAPAKVSKAKLGLYTTDPAKAVTQAEFADTPEQ